MIKNLKKSFKSISKKYQILVRSNVFVHPGSNEEWLLDNYYVFFSEYQTVKNCTLKSKNEKECYKKMRNFSNITLKKSDFKFNDSVLLEALESTSNPLLLSDLEISLLPVALTDVLFEKSAELLRMQKNVGELGALIKSILAVRDIDRENLIDKYSKINILLNSDPTYKKMTFESKKLYRDAITELSKKSEKTEEEVVKIALNLAKGKKGLYAEGGYYLIGEGRGLTEEKLNIQAKKKPRQAFYYLLSVFILSALLCGITFISTHNLLCVAIAIVPSLGISISIIQYIALKSVPPKVLPRLEFKNGIEEKVIIVYPTLLTSAEKAEEMVKKLEICYLANRDDNLKFVVY